MITREMIEQHARRGEKIQAIKCYRELTGSGLAESKGAVEHFMASGSWGAQTRFGAGGPATSAAALTPAGPAAPAPSRGALAEVEAFARANKKIDAIKALRERLEIGLKDAKDAVEFFMERGAWPDQLGQSTARGPVLVSALSPAPLPPNPRTSTPAPSKSPPTTKKEDPGARAPAEALEVLRQRIGAAAVEAIYEVEKDLTRGLLAVSGQGAFFLAERFGRWQLDREYLRAEGIRAQVRRGFTSIELRLEKTFIYDLITGLDEPTAERVARLIDPNFSASDR